MSDVSYYDQSVPPQLYYGDISGHLPFNPASFATIAAIAADATYGNGSEWSIPFGPKAYVVLGDASRARWDGLIWFAVAPTSEPPDEVPTTITPTFDPGEWTVADVRSYVENIAALHGDEHADVIAEIQRVLDDERDGLNRSTLVAWLDARLGAV